MSDIFVIDKLSDIGQSCSQRELDSLFCASLPDTNEKQLWCAVIRQAWHDFFTLATGDHTLTVSVRSEAESFLFDKHGNWAKSREAVCEAAGIDPDSLREAAIKKRREVR